MNISQLRDLFDCGRRAIVTLVRHREADPPPRMPLVPVAAVLLAGGLFGGSVPCGVAGAIGWWLAAVAALVGWWLAGRLGRHRLAVRMLLLAVALAGAAWCGGRRNLFSREDLAWRLDVAPRPVVIEGVAAESPRRIPRSLGGIQVEPASEFVIRVVRVRLGSSWKPASGRASVVVDGPPPEVLPGAVVRVFGRGVRPSPPLNPHEFDFRTKARDLGCLSLVRCRTPDCVEMVAVPPCYSPAVVLHGLRSWGMARLEDAISPDRLAFAQALLLGSREGLPREESRDFLTTGTVHILSISGLHVGILAAALALLLRATPLPPGWSPLLVALLVGLYMLLVRAETPVVRATLIVWLACLAAASGRRPMTLNSLAAAAIAVFLWRPTELFRVGTQLSFLSTGVLVAAVAAFGDRRPSDDPIERLIERSRPVWEKRVRRIGRGIVESFVAGAAVWAVTAPIAAATFHLFTPVAILLNVVIAPLVAAAMAFGFLCLVGSAVAGWIGRVFGSACDASLAAVEVCVGAASALPGAYAWVPGPPAWWIVGWYASLALVAALAPLATLRRGSPWVASAGGWAFVGLLAAVPGLVGGRVGGFEMVATSLGHGLGVVVRSPDGATLLYDAGRLGAPGAAARGVSGVLWGEGLRRIDHLVLSHADTDHFNAVPELLERFAVGRVVVTKEFLRSSSPAAIEAVAAILGRGIPIDVVRAGDSFPLGRSALVRVLHPTGHEPACSDNEASVVLSIDSSGRRLLLAGDLEGDALDRLIARTPGRCDVLVAPHHGTATSLPPSLAAATRPRIVVVSGLGGPGWDEVRRAYATAGGGEPTRVLKTGGGGGAIRIRLDADRLGIERYAPTGWQPDRYRHAAATSSSMLTARNVKNSVWPP